MEEEIQLKTKDNHIIYGTINSKQSSKTLLVFVHGLTGDQYEHHYFNAVPFLQKKVLIHLDLIFIQGVIIPDD